MKLVDEKLCATFRGLRPCEWCGHTRHCVASHVYTRGAGRVDIPENLCSMCAECEAHHHNGARPTTKDMETIVALREGIQAEDIFHEVSRIRRLPQPSRTKPVAPLTKKLKSPQQQRDAVARAAVRVAQKERNRARIEADKQWRKDRRQELKERKIAIRRTSYGTARSERLHSDC